MLISVLPDGNCFFRCVAAYLDNSLKNAIRNDNGKINSKQLREKENYFSKFIRLSCVNLIEIQKDRYDCTIDYDDTIYDSIEDRIEKMYKNTEFVGRLEIKTISKMFKICFNIYFINESSDNLEKFNLINTIGQKGYRKCNLLLENNHYSLIDENLCMSLINRPDTPIYQFKKTRSRSLTDDYISPINFEDTKFNFNLSEIEKLNRMSPPPPPVPPRSIHFNIPPPLTIVSPAVSPIKEEISLELKSYIDTQISMAKIELLDMFKRENTYNKQIVEQIEQSAVISNNLQELIEKLHKNN